MWRFEVVLHNVAVFLCVCDSISQLIVVRTAAFFTWYITITNNFDAHQIDWLLTLWEDSCDSIELRRFPQHHVKQRPLCTGCNLSVVCTTTHPRIGSHADCTQGVTLVAKLRYFKWWESKGYIFSKVLEK